MEEPKLIEIRCPRCNKLWFKAQGEKIYIEVKCHNCHDTFVFAGLWFGHPVFIDPKYNGEIIFIS